MNNLFKKRLVVEAVCAALFCAPLAFASPLTLPTRPLITGSAVKPNMMLLLDSSGSMTNIVEDAPYSAATDYYNCPADKTLANGSRIDIKIKSDGDVSFEGKTFGETDEERCFADDLMYKARLYGDDGSGDKKPSGYGDASYSGNYLNWYFSEVNFGADARKKPGTFSRMEVAKAVAGGLIDGLQEMRVGIAQYDGKNGAEILTNIADVATQGATLKAAIAAINSSGMTPLAEALQDLGRYFTAGATDDLTLHPGETNSESCPASSIFDSTPSYKSGLSAPAAVTQYWCQQNFIVAMTDGLPTADTTISVKLQDYDGDCADESLCDNHDKKKTGYTYLSSGSDYADDVILAMHDMDLRPDLKNKNNVTTYVIGFADSILNGDQLMLDMAAAGGGGALLSAANSSDLVDAFQSATLSIFDKVAANSAVSFNTRQLAAESALYQASFNTAGWKGSLKAFELSDTGEISTTASWDAADKLDNMASADRNLFTYNVDTQKGVEFKLASLSAAQKADLYAGPDADADGSATDNDDAQLLIDYLRGDDAHEGAGANNYRVRSSRLGDIVNSTSVYVGEPELNWPDYSVNNKFGASGASYSTFKAGIGATRTPMLYVGANDGMLHGFNGELTGSQAGKEKFAYIPGIIASADSGAGLHYLAEKDYAHRFYVDLTPTVSDVYINSAWRSVLVGGLRAGGKGVFALDVSNPANFTSTAANAEKLALWEFSSADDNDFGYSYSQPTVTMMANGKWAVITGNGYNNSGDGHAKLFILFIEEGADGSWDAGDYIEIDTEVGGTGTPNGLSTPRVVDTDGDSVADRVYAGDLQGNMWAFDVNHSDTKKWKLAHKDKKPLFTARNDSGQIQPITSAPAVTRNPNLSTIASNEPNLLVLFGTGKYLEGSDVSGNLEVMSYYSVLDAKAGEKLRANLTPRELLTYNGLRSISGNVVDWNTSSGWYFDLVERTTLGGSVSALGERVVSGSKVRRKVLFFNTNIPSGSACSSGGTGWLMSLSLDTGLAPKHGVFDANKDEDIDESSAPVTTDNDSNNDGVVDDGDVGYIGEISEDGLVSDPNLLGDKRYTQESTGEVIEDDVNTGEGQQEGRLSWEEQIQQ